MTGFLFTEFLAPSLGHAHFHDSSRLVVGSNFEYGFENQVVFVLYFLFGVQLVHSVQHNVDFL